MIVAALAIGGLSTGARAATDDQQGLENREVKQDLEDFKPATPKELRGVQIKNNVGDKIPADVKLVSHEGEDVVLGDYLKDGKPALVVLGYYKCPTLCSAILNGTLDALKEVSLDAGRDFNVIVVSIDPKEGPEVASKKRASYVKAYARDGAASGWHFHTGAETEVRRLADALGFGYRWDETSQQYAHAGGIFFLSPDSTLSRTLWGMSFKPRDVKFALIDASQGKVGSVVDQVLLSCFSYTPDSQRYSVYIFGVMRLAGVATIVLLGGALIFLWRRFERKKRRKGRKQ
jgi:protein SCO1/2